MGQHASRQFQPGRALVPQAEHFHPWGKHTSQPVAIGIQRAEFDTAREVKGGEVVVGDFQRPQGEGTV